MNNSKIALDNLETGSDSILNTLQKQRGELSQIVEAINGIETSEHWQKLKRLVLDGVVKTLEKQLMNETSKPDVNLPEIYRLQGQIAWARKYTDLKKLSEWFKHQLENIKNQINEHNPGDGAL